MQKLACALFCGVCIPVVAEAGCGGLRIEMTGKLRVFQGQLPNGNLVDVIQMVVSDPIEAVAGSSDECV